MKVLSLKPRLPNWRKLTQRSVYPFCEKITAPVVGLWRCRTYVSAANAVVFLLATSLLVSAVWAQDRGQSNDVEDFRSTPLGKAPEDMLILNGAFTVAAFDGVKCLELAPDPLDGDGLLFGPVALVSSQVTARIWADASGHRFPEFGIGSNDAGGYKLIVVPTLGTVELRRGDDVKVSSRFSWKPGTWTKLKLEVGKSKNGNFLIQGKIWQDGQVEPKESLIAAEDAEAPAAGRASLWGMPYSGKPIRFTDLGSQGR